ncbi:MAG: hypothetical protein GY722_06145 [bacterium]|nr:hypothetical protein [bacterium]
MTKHTAGHDTESNSDKKPRVGFVLKGNEHQEGCQSTDPDERARDDTEKDRRQKSESLTYGEERAQNQRADKAHDQQNWNTDDQ